MADRQKIVIVGAGIAGLSAALMLAEAGYQITIIEKSPRVDKAGVGIQLSPNATGILDSLGLSGKLADAGFAPQNVVIADGCTGEELSRLALGETIKTRHGHPYLVLHRADLATILLGACVEHAEIEIEFNTGFEDAVMHKRGITIMAIRTGQMVEYSAAALIGADGVGSRVRSRIIRAPAAIAAGDVAWRALVPVNKLPRGTDLANTRLWIAQNGHVVTYPLRQSSMLNIVAITPAKSAPGITGRMEDIDPAFLMAFYQDWGDEVQHLLQSADSWSGWPLREINPAGDWTNNTTALIGDAAHAMLPYLAQGGAAAIEDAAMLAKCLENSPNDMPAALQNYAGYRRTRTRKIWQTARRYGKIYHMGKFSAPVRNIVMKATGSARSAKSGSQSLHRKMDWLYGWKPR